MPRALQMLTLANRGRRVPTYMHPDVFASRAVEAKMLSDGVGLLTSPLVCRSSPDGGLMAQAIWRGGMHAAHRYRCAFGSSLLESWYQAISPLRADFRVPGPG